MMTTTTTQRTTALRLSIPTKKNSNNIVVIGGGIQGTSVAYHLAKATQQEFIAKTDSATAITSITILEAKAPASAASGKGGGFMARSWGNGTPTQRLHELAFDMYSEIANEIGCESFRKLPVLSVSPGYNGVEVARKDTTLSPLLPNWLDGNVGTISAMGYGQDTAQVTPLEFVQKMIQATSDRVSVVLGTCTGIETDPDSEQENGTRTITAVKYTTQDGGHEALLPADVVIVSAGPWSCAAEQWFQGAVALPMEGIKSTSIVWKKPEGDESVDATALFCGEHDQFGTHCKYIYCFIRQIQFNSNQIKSELEFTHLSYCDVGLTKTCPRQWRYILDLMVQSIYVVLEDLITFQKKSCKREHFEMFATPSKIVSKRRQVHSRKCHRYTPRMGNSNVYKLA